MSWLRWTSVLVASLAVAGTVGCYGPAYHDCEVSCASGAGCPSGLTCDEAQHRCRAEGQTGACTVTGDDGGGPIEDVNTSCWHGVTPSNFGPCDPGFPPAIAAVTFGVGEVLDTDAGKLSSSSAPAPGGRYTFEGHDVWLLHMTSWNVAGGMTFNTIGVLPLLVVTDGAIVIDGTVNLLPTPFHEADCGMLDGDSSAVAGAGAAGGGHAATGGSGGQNGEGTAGQIGGIAHGDPTLIPLTIGCAGGVGGDGGASNHGGHGGFGGGAIELAAQTSIRINGRMIAAGGGAGGGAVSVMNAVGCNGNVACAGGGGGGGAGGAILLEAPSIDVAQPAIVCAVGGGGGEGGDSAIAGVGQAGTDGSCTGGTGGSSIRAGGDGGNGSISGPASPGMQGGTTATPTGGGGGGGAPGRIRIHATTPSVAGTVEPPAAP